MQARLLASLAACFISVSLSAPGRAGEALDIPYQRFVLDNGLTLLVHEDHKAPIVSVNVWYHVGSKDEKPGKTGFAHLFEHLMFNGSENHNDEYFRPFERVGATDMNGTTNNDRTNYFQNVPKNALDLALWMESDRMGHLLGAIDKAKLDEQRGVVQNEKRQRENQPFGKMMEHIGTRTFPPGHPYAWQVIGSMEDLNAASLEDVQHWFKEYYGAANAVVVVAGDVKAEEARQKVERYFGSIAPGPALVKSKQWIARMQGEQRDVIHDKVPNARLYMVWNTPPVGDPAASDMELLSDVLTGDDSSLLSKKLVRELKLAANVSAMYYDREIAGQFWIVADALNPQDLERIEQETRKIIAEIARSGPDKAALEKTRARFRSGFIRSAERIGGFGGKADILAQGEVYFGNPAHYKVELERAASATPARLAETARAWLQDGVYVAQVLPQPRFHSAAADADRRALPGTDGAPELNLPAPQRAVLENGLQLVLLERHNVPLVEISLQFKGGFAADHGQLLGGSNFMLNMLKRGTRSLDADQIAERETLLGAEISAGASLDTTSIQMSALSENLSPSMKLLADVTLNPAFPEAEINSLKLRWLNELEQEKADPKGVAMRLLGQVVFGREHPYGVPFSGTGTAPDIQQLDGAKLAALHAQWMRPDNAVMIVAGDLNMEQLKALAREHFGGWKAPKVPVPAIAYPPIASAGPRVFVVDQPGATQSTVIAARTWPERPLGEILAGQLANDILGGMFTSRLNMNLREEKHWSYGARSTPPEYAGPNLFYAMAMVQADKTAPAMQEMVKEFEAIRGTRPPSSDEYRKALEARTQKLPGYYETLGALLESMSGAIELGRPDDYLQRYPGLLRAVKQEEVARAAQAMFAPGEMIWLVVGDMQKLRPQIEALKLGAVQALDGEGLPAGK